MNLVKNLEWLDTKKLDGFINEVAEILKNNKLLTRERITKITQQIQLRIDYITKLKENKNNN